MSKHREQSLKNRSDILKKCYPLVATGSWDAIAISDIEKVIKQTRGAIAYYFKNKKTLFANILDELFFPVFALSDDEREKLAKSTVTDFYNKYKTPFERVRDDLRDNYGVENPSQAIFNLFIQGSKHYDKFTSSIGDCGRNSAYDSTINFGRERRHQQNIWNQEKYKDNCRFQDIS